MKRKFSKEMMQAHRDTMRAYELMIGYAKNTDNELYWVQRRTSRFYGSNCRYCKATNIGSVTVDCSQCILDPNNEDTFPEVACRYGPLLESRREVIFANLRNRKTIIEIFEDRLNHLALQAEYVLTDGE